MNYGGLAGPYIRFDPMVAKSFSGFLWLGATWIDGTIGGSSVSRLTTTGTPGIAFTTSSSARLSTVGGSCSPTIDKGLIAVGPEGPNSSNERMYINWIEGGPTHGRMYIRRSNMTNDPVGGTPPGTEWNENPVEFVPAAPTTPCVTSGFAPIAVVARFASVDPGRIVVAYSPSEVSGLYQPVRVTTSPPGGQQWLATPPTLAEAASGSPGQNETIKGFDPSDVWNGYEIRMFPSIASDPTNPDVIYVVFSGSNDLESNPNQNVDLYIARGVLTGNQTTPITFDPLETLRLHDATLGTASDADQGMPAVTVDDCGQIHITYYNLRNDATLGVRVRARMVTIPNFTASTQPACLNRDLAPEFSPVDITNGTKPPGRELGDYLWVDSDGCFVYPIFVCGHEGQTRIYMGKIQTWPGCRADVDEDCYTGTLDFAAFAIAYAACDPEADVNKDSVVDAQDLTDFLTDYLAGGGP
ncbi:MAG: hypothetical protein ACKVW3_08250 [Phycisphaerales bacterium]